MRHRPFDRTFNMEFGYWRENYSQWDIFRENGITDVKEANGFFGFDRFEYVRGDVWLSPAFESKMISGGNGHTKIIMNEDGLLAEVHANDQSSIPHFINSSVATPEDWKRCKEERLVRGDPKRNVDVASLTRTHPKSRSYPLGVYCGSMIGAIRDMLTFEGLAYACCDYPDMVEDMVETSCALTLDYLDQVLPHMDFDFGFSWEDICYKNGPIVNIGFFREVVLPRYKRIGKKLSAHGIDLWIADCDGDVRHIIPYFLEGGINCIIPYEVNACGHPSAVLGEYGKELRIMGGVDKMRLKAGKEAIKAYLEPLAPLVEGGGYIPFCDHRCPPDVSAENYLYYLDLKEKLFGMK